MGKDQWLIYKIATAGLFLFLSLFVHGSIISAGWETYMLIQSQRDKIQEAHSWQEVTRRLELENKSLKEKLKVTAQSTLTPKSQSGFIDFLHVCAVKSGLTLLGLTPKVAAVNTQITELPSELTLQGTYHQVGKFLHLLEASENVIQVQSVDIKTDDMISEELSINANISMFRLNPKARSES